MSDKQFKPRAARLALLALLAFPAWAATQTALDPTQAPRSVSPSANPAAAEAPLRLQAIVLAGAQRYAVIDGQQRRVGDWLGEARILAIDSQAVKLQRHDQVQWLRLAPSIVQPSR